MGAWIENTKPAPSGSRPADSIPRRVSRTANLVGGGQAPRTGTCRHSWGWGGGPDSSVLDREQQVGALVRDEAEIPAVTSGHCLPALCGFA